MIGAGVLLALVAAFTAAPQEPPEETPKGAPLLVAGGAEHLWFVTGPDGGPWTLWHRALAMERGEVRRVGQWTERPEAMASADSRVWIAFPPRSAELARPYVLSVRAVRNPASGLWFTVPADRMDLLPAAPYQDEVESLAATELGPIVLPAKGAALFTFDRKWSSVELPAELAASDGRVIEAFPLAWDIMAPTGAERGLERWRLVAGRWERCAVATPAGGTVTPISGASEAAALVVSGDHSEVVTLLDSAMTSIAPVPAGATVAWLGSSPVFLVSGPDRAMAIREYDRDRGDFSPAQTLHSQSSLAPAWYHLPILAAIGAAVLMTLFFVRSLREETAFRMPDGYEALPASVRFLALAIDLAPMLLVAKIVWGASWERMLMLPAFTADIVLSLPSLSALGMTVLVGTLCEIFFGTTLGKSLVRARPVSVRVGAALRPTIRQTLSRNVFKIVVMDMPFLGVLMLFNEMGQGVGELVSGTAVARLKGESGISR